MSTLDELRADYDHAFRAYLFDAEPELQVRRARYLDARLAYFEAKMSEPIDHANGVAEARRDNKRASEHRRRARHETL